MKYWFVEHYSFADFQTPNITVLWFKRIAYMSWITINPHYQAEATPYLTMKGKHFGVIFCQDGVGDGPLVGKEFSCIISQEVKPLLMKLLSFY